MRKDNQREEIAYIAGLIDGEGSIRMQKSIENKQNPKYQPKIQITNTNLEAVELVSRFFGNTKVYIHEPSKYGFVGRRTCYVTQRSGSIAVKEILDKLIPFLRIKRKQALLILKYCDEYSPTSRSAGRWGNYRTNKETQFRESIYKKIKKLNAYKLSHPQRLNEETSKDEAIV